MLGQRSEPPTTIDRSGAQLAALERYAAQQRDRRRDFAQREQVRREPGQREPGQREQVRREPGQSGPAAPVVGPTAALWGRAGGPGFESGDRAADSYDPGLQSGWQLADGLWRDSGIRWAQTAVRLDQTAVEWEETAVHWAPPASPAPPRVFASAPVMADTSPLDIAPLDPAPLGGGDQIDGGAETVIDAPVPDAFRVPAAPSARERVPRGAAPRGRGPRNRGARQLVRVGLPVAVIVTVGAGAFMMLTGRSSEMLASSANQNPQAGKGTPAANNSTMASSTKAPANTPVPGSGTQGSFGGYPGQQGSVSVNSIATVGGTELAAGGADGHPAIWRRDPSGHWALVSARQPAVYGVPGTASLGGIADGKAGWIAVGGATSGTPGTPVVLTSADGVTWNAIPQAAAFSGAGLITRAVAAGPDGYAVVGQQVTGGRKFAAMWWSPDLKNWVRAGNGNLDGRLSSSDAIAVAATPTGFVAVGSHGGIAAIWTTAAGVSWTPVSFPPAGTVSSSLRWIAVDGSRVVAAGDGTTQAGATVPFVLTSTDNGQHWQQIILAKPGVSAQITDLSATGPGFTATGTSGGRPATWTSPDGLTWTESGTSG